MWAQAEEEEEEEEEEEGKKEEEGLVAIYQAKKRLHFEGKEDFAEYERERERKREKRNKRDENNVSLKRREEARGLEATDLLPGALPGSHRWF